MKKWEYHVQPINLPGAVPQSLNQKGEEGWELVQVISTTFYFKREKK